MKFISNVGKPFDKNTINWINRNKFIIKNPKSTKEYTVKQLKKMNMVGIYKE